MKRVLFLLLAVILLASCNQAVCPAYSDSANKVKTSIFQSGSYRADGIHKVYRDTYRKR